MAVDDDADTYWASRFDDTKAPVEYVIDLGEAQKLQSIELSWEFPARAFAVASSVDGEHFADVFATDANVLKSSRVSLGGTLARKLRISMFEVRIMSPLTSAFSLGGNFYPACLPCLGVLLWTCEARAHVRFLRCDSHIRPTRGKFLRAFSAMLVFCGGLFVRQVPRASSLWHPLCGGVCRPLALRGVGVRKSCEEFRCARQVLSVLRWNVGPFSSEGFA